DDRRGDADRRAALPLRGGGGRRDPGAAPDRRGAALPDRGASAAPAGTRGRERVALAAGGARRAPALTEPRLEAPGVRAVRPARRLTYRPPSGPRRGGAAPTAEHARPRRRAGRAGPRRAGLPARGAAAG